MSNGPGHRLMTWHWLLLGGAVTSACATTEEEPFTVPFRHGPPPAIDSAPQGTERPGDPAPPSEEPPPTGECAPEFCPDVAFGAPCCLPNGTCGMNFGTGCIALPAEAGSPSPPPPPDASVDSAASDAAASDAATGDASTDVSIAPVEVSCRHADDCGQDEVCCGVRSDGSYTVFECRESCDSTSTTVSCSSPDHCTGDEVCCGTRETGGGFGAGFYTEMACAESCSGGNQNIQCSSEDDCTGTTSCLESTLLPDGFTVCR